MTFLATRDGQLVDGAEAPWPRPWGFRCDSCRRTLPYGVVIGEFARREHPDQARQLGYDRHRCGDCESETLSLGLFREAAR